MILDEKFKKIQEIYPDDFITKLMMAGAIVGSSGVYTSEELTNMMDEVYGVLAQVMIDKVKSFDEALLLMNGLTREFLEKTTDIILDEINKE